MASLGASDWLWKPDTGYYTETAEDVLKNPYLPDPGFLQDRRIMTVFTDYGKISAESDVLEIGCGRSPWLPYLARTTGCRAVGVDIEPHAAELARANMAGAQVQGEIFCRDAFDVQANADLMNRFDLVYSLGVVEHLENAPEKLDILARYLKPGGRLMTLVPNLQGLNWTLQRLGSLRVLQAHVVYTAEMLKIVHERAGLQSVTADYIGFMNAYLSSSLGEPALRQRLHRACCRMLAIATALWTRSSAPTPEWPWLAPMVFCVGRRIEAESPTTMLSAPVLAGQR
ncbi:MAG: class I SAM-dependent methyltransferase [Nitrospiraceae bacterium]|nr:class I SAM-dependent methyltransferase [Nitrospiraceae bacterium]